MELKFLINFFSLILYKVEFQEEFDQSFEKIISIVLVINFVINMIKELALTTKKLVLTVPRGMLIRNRYKKNSKRI